MFTKDVPVFDSQDIADSKIVSGIAYLYILFFLPLLTNPKSAFGRYNANQALVLFLFNLIFSIAFNVVNIVVMWVPIIGGLFGMVIHLFNILIFVVVVVCIVKTVQGQAVRVPIIGHITLIK